MQRQTSDGDYPHVTALKQRVNSHFQRERTSGAAKQAATDWLQQHRDIRTLADSTRSYEEWLISYIQREQGRHDPSNDAYAGTREKALCTCKPANCPLKQGKLPRELSNTATINEGIREFRQRPHHHGDPLVLTEARETYAEIMAAVEEVYQIAETILRNYDEYDAPDEPVDLEGETEQALEAL